MWLLTRCADSAKLGPRFVCVAIICARMCVCVCVFVFVFVFAFVCVFAFVRNTLFPSPPLRDTWPTKRRMRGKERAHMCTYMCRHTYIMYVYICAYMYMHIYIYAHIYLYTNTIYNHDFRDEHERLRIKWTRTACLDRSRARRRPRDRRPIQEVTSMRPVHGNL